MYLAKNTVNSLLLANNSTAIGDDIFKKLVENSLSILCRQTETHSLTSLYNSKPDVIKELHAALLTAGAEFARHNLDKHSVNDFLVNECNFTLNRAGIYASCYDQSKSDLQLSLAQIGSFLPHIIGVDWKIDYIIKSSVSDQTQGPLFRIALSTEAYDESTQSKRSEQTEFVCNGQELQELVYKLKDAVRHCQRIAADH